VIFAYETGLNRAAPERERPPVQSDARLRPRRA
jgi:hypothetical protein